MEKEVLRVLSEELPGVDHQSSDSLVDDGVLDSLAITTIIASLTMEFGITIPYEEITEENFNSVKSMAKLVERLKKN